METYVASLELPSDPGETGRLERAGKGGGEPERPKSQPDPAERDRVYDVLRAHVEAGGERAEHVTERREEVAGAGERAAEGGQQSELADQRSYWSDVPRFLKMWTDHQERWQSASGNPRGSHRSEGGEHPGPERNAETTDVIGDVRKAEAGLSADAQRIERENASDGWLEGFEFRLKGEERLREKVAEQLKFEPRMTAREVLREVPDAIRYTFCLQPERYASGYYDIKARLESCGHEMYYSKNCWRDPEYKGINTRWVTQEGQRFEVQFHTPESFHAKHHVTHGAYERIRNPLTSRPELRELHAFQREASSAILIPDGAAKIPDYQKEGF